MIGLGRTVAALLCGIVLIFSAEVVRAAQPPAAGSSTSSSAQTDNVPEVPPAGPGVFSSQKRGATRYRLILHGHVFTSRDAIEKYLAYRAAELTLDNHFPWFIFVENRTASDKVPPPKRDAGGKRYSFRFAYWQPIWRYKISGSNAWKSWSPFSGAAFFADGLDPKTITDYEVSADIALHSGMDDDNPLGFDASAVSDFLVNQVSPPQ